MALPRSVQKRLETEARVDRQVTHQPATLTPCLTVDHRNADSRRRANSLRHLSAAQSKPAVKASTPSASSMDTPSTPATSELNHHMSEVNRLLQRLTQQALGPDPPSSTDDALDTAHPRRSTSNTAPRALEPATHGFFELSQSQTSQDIRTPSPAALTFTQLATNSPLSYQQLQQQNADLTMQLKDAIGVLETARTFM